MNRENLTLEPVILEIQAYLKAHPKAADSLTGIAKWWFEEPLRPSIGIVQRALDILVEEGSVRSSSVDGKLIYSSARSSTGQKRS